MDNNIETTAIKKSEPVSKWPKKIAPLSPEQQIIREDFLKAHLEAMQKKWYGVIENFNHSYPLRSFKKNGRCLELGAGIGSHLNWENLDQQEYHVNELRPELCQSLKKQFPQITAQAGDCQERLPYDDEFFDRILAIHVLEHLPNLPAALKEVYRLLKKDGLFSIVIPCEGGLAYKMGRNVSARPHFEKKYGQSYDWFVACEHINMPLEILEELNEFFIVNHTRYYPLLLPLINLNLVIGLTLKKR